MVRQEINESGFTCYFKKDAKGVEHLLPKYQIDLILTLFQLQNGERLLSDFTDVGSEEYVDLKIKDLKKLGGGLFYKILWTSYNRI